MSEPTLYQIDYSQDASNGAWVRAHTESLVHLGVLVPVEPDYEAADDLPWDATTKEVVDAALGIGDNDA